MDKDNGEGKSLWRQRSEIESPDIEEKEVATRT